MTTADDPDDDLTPYEREERRRYGPPGHGDSAEEDQSASDAIRFGMASDQLIALWRDLILGTWSGDQAFRADRRPTPLLLARLLKVLSDADFLLARLFGLGSALVTVTWDASLAAELCHYYRADTDSRYHGLPAVDELERLAAEASCRSNSITVHLLLGLLANHCDGKDDFTGEEHLRNVSKLHRAAADPLQLVEKLRLLEPADTDADIAPITLEQVEQFVRERRGGCTDTIPSLNQARRLLLADYPGGLLYKFVHPRDRRTLGYVILVPDVPTPPPAPEEGTIRGESPEGRAESEE